MNLGIVGQAVGLFAVTNIDDILILSLFFAQGAGHHGSARRVVLDFTDRGSSDTCSELRRFIDYMSVMMSGAVAVTRLSGFAPRPVHRAVDRRAFVVSMLIGGQDAWGGCDVPRWFFGLACSGPHG